MVGGGWLPVGGGVFRGDGLQQLLTSPDRFPVAQDQRNRDRAAVRYQLTGWLWTSWSASYNSGLPVENLGQSLDFLAAQYGPAVLKRVNFDRGRVRPSFGADAAVGADLWRKEKRSRPAQSAA